MYRRAGLAGIGAVALVVSVTFGQYVALSVVLVSIAMTRALAYDPGTGWTDGGVS